MRQPYSRVPAFSQFGPGPLTPVVKALIYTNVAVFLVTSLAPDGVGRLLLGLFAFQPAATLERLWIWQPFTYMFLHGSVFHILFNMLVLWMFGVQLERLWGSKFFLRFYFVSGVGAALITLAACWLPFEFAEATYLAPTIGASGATYGLLMAFAIHYPETPIWLLAMFPIPAKYFVLLLGAIAFVSTPRGGGIAHVTHLGGLAAGYWYLRSRMVGVRLPGLGRLGVMADIKYRYMRWKMARLRKKFEIHPGKKRNWDDTIH